MGQQRYFKVMHIYFFYWQDKPSSNNFVVAEVPPYMSPWGSIRYIINCCVLISVIPTWSFLTPVIGREAQLQSVLQCSSCNIILPAVKWSHLQKRFSIKVSKYPRLPKYGNTFFDTIINRKIVFSASLDRCLHGEHLHKMLPICSYHWLWVVRLGLYHVWNVWFVQQESLSPCLSLLL